MAPDEEDVVLETFPEKWLMRRSGKSFGLPLPHVEVSEGASKRFSHRDARGLEETVVREEEVVLPQAVTKNRYHFIVRTRGVRVT